MPGKALQGGASLGHLHQRKNPLLHSGPAAGGENNEGELGPVGVLHRPGDLLPHSHSHAAHNEAAVHHGKNRHPAVDFTPGGDHPFREASALPGRLELVVIAREF